MIAPPTIPVKRGHSSMWFFVAIVVMAVSATAVLIVYNLNQQLKPEQVAHAQQLWREHAPSDYRLVYNIRVNRSARDKDEHHYDITVRGGVVTVAIKDNKVEPPENRQFYGMDRLLALVADNIEKDQQPGRPRTFTRAMFDPKNGALLWYVRRVMGGYERVEITMEKISS